MSNRQILNFIDGKYTEGTLGRTFEDRTPLDNSLIGIVHEASEADVDAAVQAARAALQGPWGKMSVQQRCDLLLKVAAGIKKRFDEFLEAEIADTGKPVTLASHIDIPRGAANFNVFADHVKNVANEFFETRTPDGTRAFNYALRVPKGVVGRDLPVEPAAAADDLEGRAGARLRQHGRGEAVGGDAGDGGAARRSHERCRHPARRVQRRARLRSRFGRRVPDQASGRRRHHLHRRDRTGAAIMQAAAKGVRAVSFELGGKNPASSSPTAISTPPSRA